jgi:hypothetical protein
MPKYTIGRCLYCKRDEPLKDGVCPICEVKYAEAKEGEEMLNSLFSGFKKEN